MSTKDPQTDYIDGFLRYDVLPEKTFAARGWDNPRFGRPHEIRGISKPGSNAKPVRMLAWNSDGTRLATGTESGGLRIWNARVDKAGATVDSSGTTLLPSSSKSTNPHSGIVAALAWSSTDPNILVSGSKADKAKTIAVWDVSKPVAPIATFNFPGDVLHLAFHPSLDQFAAVCPQRTRDEVFFFWRVERDGEMKWEKREDVRVGGVGDAGVVEEINSLRFWAGGDSILAVSNDGSLTAWWYPVEERPPLVPAEQDERRAKKARFEDQEEAVDEPVDELEGEREGEGEREEVEEEAAEAEGVDAEGTEPAEGTDGNGATTEDKETTTTEEKEATEETAEPAANGESSKTETTGEDVEMAEAAPNTAPASAAPSVPATAAPSTAPTPTPGSPNKDDAARKRAAELDTEAKKAAELEGRHKQLQQCFRKVPAVGSLLSLALNPRGTYFAVGGTDARVSLLDSRDWIVQKTFDQPTAAIRQLAFSPNGEFIAVAGDDPFIFILGAVSRTTIAKIPVSQAVYSIAWHPKRNTLAYSTKWKSGPVVWYLVSEVGDERPN